MNNLISGKPSMTSVEIADLVKSRHADVKRSIERLSDRGVIRAPIARHVEYVNNLGFTVKHIVYFFEGDAAQRDVALILARLCKEFTPKLPPYLSAKITFLQAINQGEAV